jgi:hypothetical protein
VLVLCPLKSAAPRGFISSTPMTTPSSPYTPTWDQLTSINHERAWKVLTRLDRDDLLTLFARALRHVEPRHLESIFSDYARPDEVGDVQSQPRQPLIEATGEFTEAAMRGEFYEDFASTGETALRRPAEPKSSKLGSTFCSTAASRNRPWATLPKYARATS